MEKRNVGNSLLKRSVLVVDDHPVVCRGLSFLINREKDLAVCGDASDIPSALKAVKDNAPDITIIDIALGNSNGVRLIEDLSARYPEMHMLALSMHDEEVYAERCLRAGARGYIMKNESPEKVISAIKIILNNDVYLSENLRTRLLNKLVTNKSVNDSPVDLLSNRELEVFELIGRGFKTSKIADTLNLSIKTIETYVAHIKRKMGLADSRDLVRHAVQWHMNTDGPSV